VLKTTLAQLPALAAASQLRSPTLLVVGQVAALAQAGGLAHDLEAAATKLA
jgi:siroheme synthase